MSPGVRLEPAEDRLERFRDTDGTPAGQHQDGGGGAGMLIVKDADGTRTDPAPARSRDPLTAVNRRTNRMTCDLFNNLIIGFACRMRCRSSGGRPCASRSTSNSRPILASASAARTECCGSGTCVRSSTSFGINDASGARSG